MASLRKHPRSRYWIACFRDSDGRLTTRSTKHTDHRKALNLADEWEATVRGQRSVAQAQRVVSELFRQTSKVEFPVLSVRQHMANWLDAKQPEVADSTDEKYRYEVGQFLAYLGERADAPLIHLQECDLKSFRDHCARIGTPKTANNKLVTVAAALKDAWLDGIIPDNIAKRVKKLKLPTGGKAFQRLPFTQEQVDSILAAATGEWKGISLFGAYTGQRLGDIVSLCWRNIESTPDGDVVSLQSKKAGRIVRVPLDPAVSAWLRSQKKGAPNTPLFPASHATYLRNKCTSPLSKQFRVLLASLGFATKREWKVQGKGRRAPRACGEISFHSFRHYLTSQLHRAGVPGAVVQDIIGHDSEVVHRVYTNIDDQTKRVGFARFSAAREAAKVAVSTAPAGEEVRHG